MLNDFDERSPLLSSQQTSETLLNTNAVSIQNAYKSYGKLNVIKNLNLNVPKGAIYGLLGPSGCGKTTILRAIVARLQFDHGAITVFDKEPGTIESNIPGPIVGYMPQEVALYNEFTINETLNYFAYLHSLNMKNNEKRKRFLLEFLHLYEFRNNMVKNLSGGQKRRVSMMCALLQEPKLLILDEPTVGVDPLLREKIWEHLMEISTQYHTTIIITTHYIEEARKADRVGLVRNGHILAENKPDSLLQIYNETTLENVFLKLCIRDQEEYSNEDLIKKLTNASLNNEVDYKKPSPPPQPPKPKRFTRFMNKSKNELKKLVTLPKWHNIKGLLYKNSILLRRDIGFLCFEFLIPIIQISLFCTCIGRQPYNLPLGVVNNETIYNSTFNASKLYVQQLDSQTFNLQYSNWSNAYNSVHDGKWWGFLDISRNFTQDTTDKFTSLDPDKTFNGSNIYLYLDATNQQITYTIQAKVTEAYQNFLAAFLKPYNINPSILQSPIVIPNPIYGEKDPQFIDFMVPGIMVTIIFSLSIGLTGLMFVLEKKDGLLDRSWVAGIFQSFLNLAIRSWLEFRDYFKIINNLMNQNTDKLFCNSVFYHYDLMADYINIFVFAFKGVTTVEIMLAHILVKVIVMSVQITVLLIMASYAFNVSIKGPFIISAILLLLQGICGMSYGLAISSVSDNEVQVLEMAIGTIFPSLLLSGIIWPVEGMPQWVRFLTNFSPLTHTAEAMRCIASRGWGLTSFSVWFGLVVLVLWTTFFNTIAAIVFTIRQ